MHCHALVRLEEAVVHPPMAYFYSLLNGSKVMVLMMHSLFMVYGKLGCVSPFLCNLFFFFFLQGLILAREAKLGTAGVIPLVNTPTSRASFRGMIPYTKIWPPTGPVTKELPIMVIFGLMNGASMVWLDQSGKIKGGQWNSSLVYYSFRYLRQYIGSQVLF
jgi:hypothetical protein